MTREMQQVYQQIIEKQEQFKALDAEIKALKARVIEYHAGNRLLCEDGYESSIKHTVRDTPQPKAIAETFGLADFDYEHHPECFKRSEYDSVTVRRFVVEG